jgi:predicted amidohydrolase YtcJ
MDEKLPVVEAVAIHENRILFVGMEEEAMKYKNHLTKIIDLQGRTMFPGFIDPHKKEPLGQIQ